MLRYLRVLGAGEHRARDLAQEAFLAALRQGVEDRGPRAAARWLRTTARRLWWEDRRRDARDEAWSEAVDRVWERLQEDDGGVAWREALRACVAALPERTRRMIERHYRDGAGREALAAELGIGPAGVKQALRRARAVLRDCILHRLGEDVPAHWRHAIEDEAKEGGP